MLVQGFIAPPLAGRTTLCKLLVAFQLALGKIEIRLTGRAIRLGLIPRRAITAGVDLQQSIARFETSARH